MGVAAWLDHLDRRVPNRHWIVWSQPVLLLWVLDLAVRGADTAVWLTLLLPWAYASGAVIGRPSLSDLRAGPNSTSLRFWPAARARGAGLGRSNARLSGTHDLVLWNLEGAQALWWELVAVTLVLVVIDLAWRLRLLHGGADAKALMWVAMLLLRGGPSRGCPRTAPLSWPCHPRCPFSFGEVWPSCSFRRRTLFGTPFVATSKVSAIFDMPSTQNACRCTRSRTPTFGCSQAWSPALTASIGWCIAFAHHVARRPRRPLMTPSWRWRRLRWNVCGSPAKCRCSSCCGQPASPLLCSVMWQAALAPLV